MSGAKATVAVAVFGALVALVNANDEASPKTSAEPLPEIEWVTLAMQLLGGAYICVLQVEVDLPSCWLTAVGLCVAVLAPWQHYRRRGVLVWHEDAGTFSQGGVRR